MENTQTTNQPLKVSVIIPTYNESTVLSATLARLKVHQPFEILIGDGGSGDDTVSIARQYAIPVIPAPLGRASQMNAAAGEATGDL